MSCSDRINTLGTGTSVTMTTGSSVTISAAQLQMLHCCNVVIYTTLSAKLQQLGTQLAINYFWLNKVTVLML
jgi:hypothetical protein